MVGVEYIYDVDDGGYHAFRTAPNKRINPATDELGTLAPSGHNSKGSGDTYAYGINDSGQAVGTSDIGINVRIALLRLLITMARWWALPTCPATRSTE